MHWEDWIPREGEFPVVGYSINSTLHSVPACQSIVKKAVVERLERGLRASRTLPETGRALSGARFSIMKDEVTRLGSTPAGEGLYKRGYRAARRGGSAQGDAGRRDGEALALQRT